MNEYDDAVENKIIEHDGKTTWDERKNKICYNEILTRVIHLAFCDNIFSLELQVGK